MRGRLQERLFCYGRQGSAATSMKLVLELLVRQRTLRHMERSFWGITAAALQSVSLPPRSNLNLIGFLISAKAIDTLHSCDSTANRRATLCDLLRCRRLTCNMSLEKRLSRRDLQGDVIAVKCCLLSFRNLLIITLL